MMMFLKGKVGTEGKRDDQLLQALKMRMLQDMLGKMKLVQAGICKDLITEKQRTSVDMAYHVCMTRPIMCV
ncbi:hypothetical protein llap_2925 [Limosa lapponica baueri]|uniref:Uncharacterized protein n=1 Tax=Limosa lapponica baueri TaxID=1758121 RepID=A0A2I0UL33_LIMLA|nr:hypothetical protein llap_2925 [Limosa lapponica baueri]